MADDQRVQSAHDDQIVQSAHDDDQIVQSAGGGVELGPMPRTWKEQIDRIHDALCHKSWEIVERVLSEYGKEIFAARLTKEGLTPLLVAAKCRDTSFIQKLIEMMPPELLLLTDYKGNTALHLWAQHNQTREDVAKLLLEKCPDMRYFQNVGEEFPELEGVDVSHIPKLKEPEWWGDVREAIEKAKWNTIEKIIARETPIKTFAIRLGSERMTPLYYAIKQGRDTSFLNKMIGWIPAELLALTDSKGITVIQLVAINSDMRYAKMAEMLVLKNPDLLNFVDNEDRSAIDLALDECNYPMAKYLLAAATKVKSEWLMLKDDDASYRIYLSLLRAQYYDLGIQLLEFNPRIGVRLSCLENLLESIVFSKYGRLTGNAERILKSKEVISLVHHICVTILKYADPLETERAKTLFISLFLIAAEYGAVDIVKEILRTYPPAIEFKDVANLSAFQIAVEYRSHEVFKALYDAVRVDRCCSYETFERLLRLNNARTGNNILHLAAVKPPLRFLDYIDLERRGPILQMQSDLRWFKEVEIFLPDYLRSASNNEGHTPIELFNKNHEGMVEKEINWVTSMAQPCSTAATLIATVAFASAIQVPGGTSDKGPPNYADRTAFSIFGASNALALFFSISSVLTFLSVFTSRFDADDFLMALPLRLILGLISLIISVISLMVAFASALFLLFGEKSMFLGPLSIFAALPVILYAILQIPSLLEIVQSTFWGFSFGPPPKKKPFTLYLQEKFWTFIARFNTFYLQEKFSTFIERFKAQRERDRDRRRQKEREKYSLKSI